MKPINDAIGASLLRWLLAFWTIIFCQDLKASSMLSPRAFTLSEFLILPLGRV